MSEIKIQDRVNNALNEIQDIIRKNNLIGFVGLSEIQNTTLPDGQPGKECATGHRFWFESTHSNLKQSQTDIENQLEIVDQENNSHVSAVLALCDQLDRHTRLFNQMILLLESKDQYALKHKSRNGLGLS